jgi:acyl carrier protein
MRKTSREEVLADVVLLLRKVADDWEYSGEITPDTCLIADMGFESLAVVVLGAAVQEHYKQVLPFPKLFAEIGQRERRDVSVGEWADFIHEHLGEVPLPKKPESAGRS